MAIDFQPSSHDRFPVVGHGRSRGACGFTLIELLVSTAIMLIVMLVLLQVIAGMTNIWHNSTGTISSFQSARAAFTTLTRTLSRATLKTYIDYIDSSGNPITNANVNNTGAATFTPISSFARASELQFVSGPTPNVYGSSGNNLATQLTPPATVANFPGDCVFFQAPLGIANTDPAGVNITVTGGNDKFLQKSLNTIGFYVEYFGFAANGNLPGWLATAMGVASGANPVYGFRLLEFIQPSENLDVYNETSVGTTTAYKASMDYIPRSMAWPLDSWAAPGTVGTVNTCAIVSDNITLLIVRPRLEPQDEQALAGTGGLLNGITTYSATTANSIISPTYNYDSRAWWGGAMKVVAGSPPTYTMTGANVDITNRFPGATGAIYARLMRNQLPPILDVAMVAVDPNSLVRLNNTTGVPPAELTLPATMTGSVKNSSGQAFGGLTYTTQIVTTTPAGTPFAHSFNMDVDLNNYGLYLAANHIRYRVFRASVQMEGAAWVNNY